VNQSGLFASIAQADNIYAWFEEKADPKLVQAVRACAVPVRFDKSLALHIFHSGLIGLNGDSAKVLRRLVSLPFVHRVIDGSYKYEPTARAYFDESLRNNGVDYGKLNGIIADYLAGERRVLVVNGVPEDAHPVRELKLREVYHTIPADSERGREKLDEFLSSSKGHDVLPDNWAAFRICEYQRRYLPEWQLDAWYCEGRYHYFAGDYAKALPLLEEVRRSKQRSLIVAIADHFLGVIYRDYRKRRSLPDAATVLEESVGIGREIPKLSHVAQALNTLGGVYQDQRRLKEAAEALEQARDIDRKLGNPSSLAMTLTTLGGVYKDQDRLDEAASALEEARDIDKGLGNLASLAMTLNTLGGVYKDQRRLPEAASALEESVKIRRKLELWQDMAFSLTSLGGVYQDQRRLDDAASALEESVKIRRKLELWEDMAFSLNTLGGVYRDLGMFGEAETTLCESVKICTQFNDQRGLAMACNLLGQLYAEMQEWEKAREAYKRSAEINEAIRNRRFAQTMWNKVREMEEKLNLR